MVAPIQITCLEQEKEQFQMRGKEIDITTNGYPFKTILDAYYSLILPGGKTEEKAYTM
jgi:hypothetical protein